MSAFKTIYLASRSRQRRDLLTQMGVNFEMLVLKEGFQGDGGFDETPLKGELPLEYVKRVARLKAKTGWDLTKRRQLLSYPVLAADTSIALGDYIIGKPKDREDAVEILRRLSGKKHMVHTAVAIKNNEVMKESVASTEVIFSDLTDEVIRKYVATGESFGRAGAYAIQGKASIFTVKISGSYSGVVGLPVYETYQLLLSLGVKTN